MSPRSVTWRCSTARRNASCAASDARSGARRRSTSEAISVVTSRSSAGGGSPARPRSRSRPTTASPTRSSCVATPGASAISARSSADERAATASTALERSIRTSEASSARAAAPDDLGQPAPGLDRVGDRARARRGRARLGVLDADAAIAAQSRPRRRPSELVEVPEEAAAEQQRRRARRRRARRGSARSRRAAPTTRENDVQAGTSTSATQAISESPRGASRARCRSRSGCSSLAAAHCDAGTRRRARATPSERRRSRSPSAEPAVDVGEVVRAQVDARQRDRPPTSTTAAVTPRSGPRSRCPPRTSTTAQAIHATAYAAWPDGIRHRPRSSTCGAGRARRGRTPPWRRRPPAR